MLTSHPMMLYHLRLDPKLLLVSAVFATIDIMILTTLSTSNVNVPKTDRLLTRGL